MKMGNVELIALIASCALVAAAGAAVLAALAVKRSRLKNGVYGQKKLYSTLKSFSALRGFRVLSGVTLRHGGRTAYIENLLVSFYGLLLVYTVNDKCEYYGERRGMKWTRVGEKTRETVPNMVRDGENAMSLLREILGRSGIYNMQIEQYVVTTRRLKGGATQMFVSGCPEITTLSQFKKQIHKVKYEKDNNVDVDAVIAAIESAG
mgnify:CR=1 FL=1